MSNEDILKNITDDMAMKWVEICAKVEPELWNTDTPILPVNLNVPRRVVGLLKEEFASGKSEINKFFNNILQQASPEHISNMTINEFTTYMFNFVMLEGISSIINRREDIVNNHLRNAEELVRMTKEE